MPIVRNLFIGVFFLLLPELLLAEELYPGVPDTIHAEQRYVIYSHGFIVEGDNPRPEHPVFGFYEFELIKQALFDEGEFNVIAYHRPANIPISEAVQQLVSWTQQLLDAGVEPSRITLVGFSRGGHLTGFAGSELRGTGINIGLLAACYMNDLVYDPPVILSGKVLSIYETSDVADSCETLINRSEADDFREIAISTGLSHGAFFQPREAWLAPLKSWIKETNR